MHLQDYRYIILPISYNWFLNSKYTIKFKLKLLNINKDLYTHKLNKQPYSNYKLIIKNTYP